MPIPGSPTSPTTCPRPSITESSRAARSASSWCRPVKADMRPARTNPARSGPVRRYAGDSLPASTRTKSNRRSEQPDRRLGGGDGAGRGQRGGFGQEPQRGAGRVVVDVQGAGAGVDRALGGVERDPESANRRRGTIFELVDGEGGQRGAPRRVLDRLDAEDGHHTALRRLLHPRTEDGDLLRDAVDPSLAGQVAVAGAVDLDAQHRELSPDGRARGKRHGGTRGLQRGPRRRRPAA